MEQIHGGGIMAALLNSGFTPEWTKRTLASLMVQAKNKQLDHARVSAPPLQAFSPQRLHPDRPALAIPKELPPLPVPRVAKIETVELPTAVRVKAIDVQRRQQVMVSNLNQQQPKGCHLLAFAILPVDLFQGELGKFLMMACEFYAHGAANTLLLPSQNDGARHFGLPQHPLSTSSAALAEAVTKIKALRQRVLLDHQRAANAMQSGDLTRMYDRPGRQAEYRLELANITRGLTISLFGAAAWETHEKRFRTTLDQM